eukprot:GHRR01025543.1.p1 GENE.GHRR01025543.1~~GHRR01025543.1.p1  ORF type:complete len:124 (-),score=23.45 GHRR01025543.1:544-915(-)
MLGCMADWQILSADACTITCSTHRAFLQPKRAAQLSICRQFVLLTNGRSVSCVSKQAPRSPEQARTVMTVQPEPIVSALPGAAWEVFVWPYLSYMMTVSAACRLSPTPPARKLSMNTNASEPA